MIEGFFMKVGISQSNYIPWLGYFDLIKRCDLFIFYDDVQYTTRDWRNRNKIKTKDGIKWLTIPVGHIHRDKQICDVKLKDTDWQKDHWHQIYTAYRDAKYFENYVPFFKQLYFGKQWNSLSELNQHFIIKICGELGIKTKFADSCNYSQKSVKKERLFNVLKEANATEYYSGPAGKNYLSDDDFKKENIKVHWMKYDYPEYPQLHGAFDIHVSIIDFLFNTGNYEKYL